MSEEKVIDVEATEASESEHPTLDALVKETVKLFESLGKALTSTIQDVSNLMVVDVDADTRKKLDLLVEAEVVQNRREAATSLIKEGLKNREAVFKKIERTNSQIAELRQQMRAIVGGQS